MMHTADYDLVTTWQGGLSSRTLCQSLADESHVVDSDEPVVLGGKGQAPDPQQLMLAAFNACMIAAFLQEAASEGITLTRLEIQTSGQLPVGIPEASESLADETPGRLQYVIRVSGQGTVRQFDEIHQRVINASLNRWLLAQSMLVEGDLVLS